MRTQNKKSQRRGGLIDGAIDGFALACFYSVAGDSYRLLPAMEDTLSKDELRMRLFNTFKNKGVLDKLKVSHILNTIGCLRRRVLKSDLSHIFCDILI